MILCAISCHFADSLSVDFTAWVKTELYKSILAADLDISFQYFQLLQKLEDDLTSHVIQLSFGSKVNFTQFEIEHQNLILEKIQSRYNGQVYTFVSVMTLI